MNRAFYIYGEQNHLTPALLNTLQKQNKAIVRLTVLLAVCGGMLIRQNKVNKQLRQQLHDIRQQQETENA